MKSESRRQQCFDMLLVRRFEEFVLDLFSQGELNGTTHAYIGQEAVATSIFTYLTQRDLVFSNHRCHAHYLLHQRDVLGLLAELMGRSNGVCAGIGGSQHIHRGRFYSNGVQGGIVPALLGLVWADRHLGEREAIGTVFIGDGTLGQGQVYECLNLASLWQLPMLFVLEHNGYSQSTPSPLQIAGEVETRAQAFGVQTFAMDSNQLERCDQQAQAAVEYVRTQRRPAMLICRTFRLCSHSKSDDARPEEIIAPWRDKDPLRLAQSLLSAADWGELEAEVQETLTLAYATAKESPSLAEWSCPTIPLPTSEFEHLDAQDRRVMQRLNRCLHRRFAQDRRVVLVGMDILDPYGGAFKIEKGLSTHFPQQVVPTPICETSMVGLAGGMALGGLRPLVQIMFGDFVTLGTDPLVNYISKYRGMYNGQVRCPAVIRLATGGGRGYGPTHSQCLEKLYLGLPDIRVVAISAYHPPEQLLEAAIADDSAVLFLENKLVYTQNYRDVRDGSLDAFRVRSDGQAYPTLTFSPNDFRFTDLTFACYGYQIGLALEAAERLMAQHEVAVEVVAFSLLYPPPTESFFASLGRSRGRLLTIEEGIAGGGWGAELIALASENGLLTRSGRVSAREQVIPAQRHLEAQMLPSADSIFRSALKLWRD